MRAEMKELQLKSAKKEERYKQVTLLSLTSHTQFSASCRLQENEEERISIDIHRQNSFFGSRHSD